MKPRISYDLAPLNKFAKAISKKYRTKVGILGRKSMRKDEGPNNATILLQHEYGVFSKNIPMRSFLRMPLATRANQILRDLSKGTLKLLAKGNYYQVFVNLGIKCEDAIQKAFESSGWGAWAPNKRSTVLRKTPMSLRKKLAREGKPIIGKPLIDTAQLRRSISSKAEAVK